MSDVVFGLKKDVDDIARLHPNRKFLLISLFVLLFIISFVVGGFILKKSPPQNPSTSPENSLSQQTPVTAAPSTTLKLIPDTSSAAVGQPQKVSVMLEGIPASAVDIVLLYDPNLADIDNLENGTVLSRVIRSEIEDGKITYSASLNTENQSQPQAGQLFSFEVTPKAAAKNEDIILRFDPIESLTAVNGKNTLGSSLGSVFAVN